MLVFKSTPQFKSWKSFLYTALSFGLVWFEIFRQWEAHTSSTPPLAPPREQVPTVVLKSTLRCWFEHQHKNFALRSLHFSYAVQNCRLLFSFWLYSHPGPSSHNLPSTGWSRRRGGDKCRKKSSFALQSFSNFFNWINGKSSNQVYFFFLKNISISISIRTGLTVGVCNNFEDL